MSISRRGLQAPRSLSIWKRVSIEAVLLLANYLEWHFQRLERCKRRNLKRREMVVGLLADLTHYE